MRINASDQRIMDYKWGQGGQGVDEIEENGSVIFAQADDGDVYYNGATIATMPLQAAAAAIELISDSAEDDVGGTGALTVKVSGLDGDYKWVTETLIMTGVVAVVGTQLFMRIMDIQVMTAGTHTTNVGAIDCQAVAGGQVWDRIVADEGLNQHSLITVPAGYILWIAHWAFTSSALTAQTFRLMERPFGGAWVIKEKRCTYFGGQVQELKPFRMAKPYAAKTDIKMNASVGAAATITSHMGGFLTTTQKR